MTLITLLEFFALLITGYLLALIFLPKANFFEKFAIGFLLSIGFLTLLMFLLNIVGVKFGLTESTLIMVSMITLFGLINIIKFDKKYKFSIRSCKYVLLAIKAKYLTLNRYDKVLMLLIFLFFTSSLFSNYYWPVRTWDSLTLYDFRAKYFFETGYMESLFGERYYLGHGMMNSLTHTWLYLIGVTNPMFIYSLIYISFITSFYFAIRRKSKVTSSLAFTLILTIAIDVFNHSIIAYSNLAYAVYMSLGFIYLYLGYRDKDTKMILLSSLLVGLSTWVRDPEPFWAVAIFLTIIVGYFSKRYYLPIIYGFFVFLIRSPWVNYRKSKVLELTTGLQDTNPLEVILKNPLMFNKMYDVINFVNENVLSLYGYLLLAFLLLLVDRRVKNGLGLFILFTMVIGSLSLVYAGVYVSSLTYDKWYVVGDSVRRMTMFLAPTTLFAVSELFRLNRSIGVKNQKS